MPTIVLLMVCSILILVMALALARELRLRRSYERLLAQILDWRNKRDAPMPDDPDPMADDGDEWMRSER